MSYEDTIRETTIEQEIDLNESDSSGLKSVVTSSETISDYKNYCRELCYNIVADSSDDKIGGPGKTVEIDESKFGKNKYNVGRYVEGQWVFGGICREDKKFFL